MSDAARKDFSTQAKETFTPDSQKSSLDKAGETVTDAGDRVAAAVQPGDSKSTTQKLGDTARSESDGAQKGYVEQAQDALGSLAKTASDTATNLANSITGEKK